MLLYKLEIENFYSIRERQVIDLTIAPNVPDEGGRYAPIFPGSRLRAPKVVAVYGANGSGKTTVLRALQFLFNFLRTNSPNRESGLAISPFQDKPTRSQPIRLALEFGGIMDLNVESVHLSETEGMVKHGTYRYELEVEVDGGEARRVAKESLHQKPIGQGKWQRVFERLEDGTVKGSKAFPLGGYRHLLNTLRTDTSVIGSFALFQHPAATPWWTWAMLVGIEMEPMSKMREKIRLDAISTDKSMLEQLNRDLSRIDLGVEEMKFEETPGGMEPFFRHRGLGEQLPWMMESRGTRSFINMFPTISGAITFGRLCIIDELDSAVHPMVIEEILRWFYDNERNPKNGQIWFTCHSASLLENLNKEEAVLTEKNRQGRTTAYSLMDVKDLRRDDNLYRKYLSGVLGGVPRIG